MIIRGRCILTLLRSHHLLSERLDRILPLSLDPFKSHEPRSIHSLIEKKSRKNSSGTSALKKHGSFQPKGMSNEEGEAETKPGWVDLFVHLFFVLS